MTRDETPAARDALLEAAVEAATQGDRHALETIVAAVQPQVYGVALRFLWHPQDAEDATQEILIRVITGLASFRGDCRFRAWVYRIACNTLLTLGRKRMEQQSLSFERFGQDLSVGLSDAPPPADDELEHALLLEEVKIGCTLGMLLCLDRDHRLAYILGEILDLDHQEGSAALAISPAAFRKRLSRAREAIGSFMISHCGLANPANPCRCRRRVATAIERGRVDIAHPLFATSQAQARRFPQVLAQIRALDEARRAAALFRSHPEPAPSASFAAWVRRCLDHGPAARADGDGAV